MLLRNSVRKECQITFRLSLKELLLLFFFFCVVTLAMSNLSENIFMTLEQCFYSSYHFPVAVADGQKVSLPIGIPLLTCHPPCPGT